jgi:CDGSH iron-sulfur domain-containing protein 3
MTHRRELGGRMLIPIEVTAGETYWWCACGRSKNQPFCNGSHDGTSFAPLERKADRTRRLLMCTRKRTARAPICDNSHLKL